MAWASEPTAPLEAPLRLLILSGPGLHALGRREPRLYGTRTLAEVHRLVEEAVAAQGAEAVCRQSNHEGDLVTAVYAAREEGCAGIVLNAGAYSHTSIALLDAVRGAEIPTVEVHLSNPAAREPYRRVSRLAEACLGCVSGFGAHAYVLGALGLLEHLRTRAGR